jgi:RNA polymerase sigma-70 factor (ECF subfamily)
MPWDAERERELIQQAVAGDRAALQGLLLAHYRLIETAILAKFSQELAGHLQVEDLVQEVLVDVHRGITFYVERENGTFVAWLQCITENRVIDTVRHYRRLKRGGGRQRAGLVGPSSESLDSIWAWISSNSDSPHRALRIKEAREMVQVCVAALKDDQRQAVVAHYFEHMDANEIADEMNRTPAAIRELLRRARKNLATLLGTASAWLSSR